MSYSLIVFGTPSNNIGFEYKILNGNVLPSDDVSYLDNFDNKTMNKGSTYVVKKKRIENIDYSMILEYRKIKPKEEHIDRGAYIAVGIILSDKITVNDSIVFFQII